MSVSNVMDGVSVPSISGFFERYGLALVMVASYFGSGSVFIASSAGVRFGYTVGGITTIAIVIAAAAVLRPAGYEQLESFLTPGRALVSVLGEWTMVVFLVGTLAAAFNSIIPIMWAPAYMIPEALGGEFAESDRVFKAVYIGGVALGSLSPLVHQYLGLSVIDMIILFPAYNGVVGLPITALLLFWAVNDGDTMGAHTNGWKLNAINSALILLAVYSAWSAGRFVINAILTGGI